jgi:PAS domain S-box-containing protein
VSVKLGASVALVVLVTVGFMSGYAYVEDRRNALQHEVTELQILSEDLATQVDQALANGKGVAVRLALAPDVLGCLRDKNPAKREQEACRAWLDLQLHQTAGSSALFLLSSEGRCLVSTNQAWIGHPFSFCPYFQRAMAGRQAVSDWMIGPISNTPHIDSCAPVFLQGNLAGAVVAEFPAEAEVQAIRAAGVHGRTAVLINQAGIALSHSNPASQYHALAPLDPAVLAELDTTRQFLGRNIPLDPLSTGLAGAFRKVQATSRPQTVAYRLGTSAKWAVLTPLSEQKWMVSVAIAQEDIFRSMNRTLKQTLLVGLATLLSGIIAVFALGRLILHPIERLSEAMGRFGGGDASARAPVLNQDERGQLAQAFNSMADALQAHQERLEERVEARARALSLSEERFRLAMDATSDGLWDRNCTTGEVYYSPAYARMLGYEPHEFPHGHEAWAGLIFPDDRHRVLATEQECIDGIRPGYEMEYRMQAQDGSWTWVLDRAKVISRDDRGRALRIIGTHVDITERMLAEDALRISRAKFAKIYDLSPEAIDLTHLESGVVVECNQSNLKIFGYTREELLNHSTLPGDLGLWVTREARDRHIANLIAHGEDREFETLLRRKDGSIFIGLLSSSMLEIGGELYNQTLCQDISERKTAETMMRRLNEDLERRVTQRTAQLEAANKELEAFSYSVSHDLRAPLRSIDGFSQALLEDYQTILDQDGKHYLSRIRLGVQRMELLIEDLLKLSRIDRNELKLVNTDFSGLCRKVVDDLVSADPGRNVEVLIHPGLSVQADPHLMLVVLENLVGNAWKFTSKLRDARVEIGGMTSPPGEQAFFIRDNGAGFDPAFSDRLFSAFQRLHLASDFEGTGIGLAIVKRIINRHGGRVWAESEPGKGAAFFFTMPDEVAMHDS